MDIYHLQGTIVQWQVKEGMHLCKHLFKVIMDNTRTSSNDLVSIDFERIFAHWERARTWLLSNIFYVWPIMLVFQDKPIAQPAFTCSKLTTKTLEQDVKYAQS